MKDSLFAHQTCKSIFWTIACVSKNTDNHLGLKCLHISPIFHGHRVLHFTWQSWLNMCSANQISTFLPLKPSFNLVWLVAKNIGLLFFTLDRELLFCFCSSPRIDWYLTLVRLGVRQREKIPCLSSHFFLKDRISTFFVPNWEKYFF